MTKKNNQKKPVKRTLHYFWLGNKHAKGLFAVTFIASPIVIIYRSVISPLLVSNIIAEAAKNPSQEEIMQNLLPQALVILILHILVSGVLGEIRIWAHWKMEVITMYYLANMAFDKVSAQSMQFHNNRFSGSLVSQTNKFVGGYERFMDSLVWNALPMFLTIIVSLAVLYFKAPIFAAGMTVLIIIYATVSYIWFKKMRPLNEAEASAENKQTGQLADSITNISSVKSYAGEKHESKRFSKYSRATAKAYMDLLHAHMKRNITFDAIDMGFKLIILIVLLFGQSQLGLDFAVLYLVITYSGEIGNELWSFNNVLKDFNRVFGDAKEMTEILDLPDEVIDLPGATELKVTDAAINFDKITFKHHDAKEAIFEDFSLQIQPGERIGLVGISGSGKTTLTKLLLRFADVEVGEITIDSQNIKQVTQESLRKNIAYVPQETSLFHRSIAENIAYGKPDASQTEIERAAKLANANEFIKDLPNGYETLVGERGVKLSGGQRQRIAIARAILKDAPILVLDEATSALDSESEALIQGALKELIKDRTSIVIAHRLSTVMNLDKIIVLKDGEIAEAGSHAELLKKDGAYARLWSRQSGAFLDEE